MELSFKCQILEPVLSNISRLPDRNAFCINDVYYTYSCFGKIMRDVKSVIHESKYKSKQIGLVINDDLVTYASIFAIWAEGMSYVPLHPRWPLDRCQDIVEQVRIDLVLDSCGSAKYEGVTTINTSMVQSYEQTEYDYIDVSDDELAYILFTSGSTGKPKGVQLSRRNIASFMDSFWNTGISISEDDRCLQCFDLSFDVSVQSYLVALIRGACVYTVPYGQKKYLYVASLIDEYHITFGAMAPSMLRYIQPYFSEIDASSLRNCILTAEACPLSLLEDMYRFAPNVTLFDFYGPTECTIYATYYRLDRDKRNKSLNGIVSIGKALQNVTGIIINEAGECLPDGEKGELCLAGDQVTPGYWNNDDKNASSFFNKIVNGTTMRFYHTGDLCFRDGEGDIMYSGRIDHQAKIQGFRVELGEIEFHSREYLQGKNVSCLAFENELGVTEIAMFIESAPFDAGELLSYLRTKMPSYMIPTKVMMVNPFPLNSNDKVDKNILKQMIN